MNAGRQLELAKTLTTLGKPGTQVAVITRRPQGYYITHVEGAEFPLINGHPLDTHACPLNDHDVVELAGVQDGIYPQSLTVLFATPRGWWWRSVKFFLFRICCAVIFFTLTARILSAGSRAVCAMHRRCVRIGST